MLTAATWAFAWLLAVAGARKVTQPAATGAALAVARLPSDERVVRMLGACEVTLGLAVLLHGGRLPVAALALTYATFGAFADRQRRQGAGCGCFGAAGTPATGLHVALNAAAAAAAASAALRPGGSLPALMTSDPLMGLLTVALLLVAASLLRLLLTAAPELTAAVALVGPRSDA